MSPPEQRAIDHAKPTPPLRLGLGLRVAPDYAQFFRFCTVGGIGYVINLSVFAGLVESGIDWSAAAVASFAVAVTSNYLWNRAWTFRERRASVLLQGARFLVVSLAALSANLLVLRCYLGIGAGHVAGQAAAIVTVTPLNFLGNRVWSFRARG